jgi:hypothetical protein
MSPQSWTSTEIMLAIWDLFSNSCVDNLFAVPE